MNKNWTPSSWRNKKALHMPGYIDEEHLENTLKEISKFLNLPFEGENISINGVSSYNDFWPFSGLKSF